MARAREEKVREMELVEVTETSIDVRVGIFERGWGEVKEASKE